MLADVSDDDADSAMSAALSAGVNLFDTSDDYGDSEIHLGRWTGELRGRGAYLATKTTERTAEAAWAGINRSLERLKVERVDILQLHSVSTWDLLEQVTAPDGAIHAVLRAKAEGLTDFIGVSGHGSQAPRIHAEMLRRAELDTLLTPWNWALARHRDFAEPFAELVQLAAAQDVGLMTIKAAARRNWRPGEETWSPAWYAPLTEQRHLTASYAWVLNHPFISSATTPGDIALLGAVLQAEWERGHLVPAAAEEILRELADYTAPFDAMPSHVV